MAVTLMALCTGIATTLATATGIGSSTDYDETTEGIAPLDTPRLEVSFEEVICDPTGATDRYAFNAGTQVSGWIIHVNVLARQRSQTDEDMGAVVEITDALVNVLQAQEKPPFFGVVGVKAMSWRARRRNFIRSKTAYVGVRVIINCKIF